MTHSAVYQWQVPNQMAGLTEFWVKEDVPHLSFELGFVTTVWNLCSDLFVIIQFILHTLDVLIIYNLLNILPSLWQTFESMEYMEVYTKLL
jgi:hypothetical protein